MKRTEIWIAAACAAISHGCDDERAAIVADGIVGRFDDRFPSMVPETHFRGIPISKLNPEQREEWRLHFYGVEA